MSFDHALVRMLWQILSDKCQLKASYDAIHENREEARAAVRAGDAQGRAGSRHKETPEACLRRRHRGPLGLS